MIPGARFFAALAIALIASSPACALVVGYAAVGEAVGGHPDVTYFDLLREVVPDLELEANGAARGGPPLAFRHLADVTCPCDPPEAVYIEGVEAQPIRSEGRERLLLLAHVSSEGWNLGGTTLLMLFDLEVEPRLIDLADVGVAEEVAFASEPLLDLSGDDQAVLIESRHWNSSQDYRTTLIIFLLASKLELIDDVFTFSDRGCSYRQVQSPSFEALPALDRPFADIKVRVKAELFLTGEVDCGEDPVEPSIRTLQVTYGWDSTTGRFTPSSDALESLAKENEQRF
jgi:hypothetical protein